MKALCISFLGVSFSLFLVGCDLSPVSRISASHFCPSFFSLTCFCFRKFVLTPPLIIFFPAFFFLSVSPRLLFFFPSHYRIRSSVEESTPDRFVNFSFFFLSFANVLTINPFYGFPYVQRVVVRPSRVGRMEFPLFPQVGAPLLWQVPLRPC